MAYLGTTTQDMDNQVQADGSLSGDWLRTVAKEREAKERAEREAAEAARKDDET